MNKKVMIILSAVVLPLILILGLLLIERAETGENAKEIEYNFDFYSENYDENIFEDAEYLALNHIISYKNGPVTISVLPEEYYSVDPVLYFISELLEDLKNGKYDEYPIYFTDNYKNKNTLPEKFTMQRIYNVTIEKISEGRGENGEAQLVYMLDFMINKNNGSLRNDMDSDSSKPWYLSIVNINGNYLIDNIITYNQK